MQVSEFAELTGWTAQVLRKWFSYQYSDCEKDKKRYVTLIALVDYHSREKGYTKK